MDPNSRALYIGPFVAMLPSNTGNLSFTLLVSKSPLPPVPPHLVRAVRLEPAARHPRLGHLATKSARSLDSLCEVVAGFCRVSWRGGYSVGRLPA